MLLQGTVGSDRWEAGLRVQDLGVFHLHGPREAPDGATGGKGLACLVLLLGWSDSHPAWGTPAEPSACQQPQIQAPAEESPLSGISSNF